MVLECTHYLARQIATFTFKIHSIMKTTFQKDSSFDNQVVEQTNVELKLLNSEFTGAASLAKHKEKLILDHVEKINQKNEGFFSRLVMSKAEKELAQVFQSKQQETLSVMLDQKNKSIKAISQSQTTYIKDLCNALLLCGRSGLMGSVSNIYMENFVTLSYNLDDLGKRVFDLIERQLNELASRPAMMQKMMMDQIETLMSKWDKQYDAVLEEFSLLLKDRV